MSAIQNPVSSPEPVDVAVIGAGPLGMLLAAELSLYDLTIAIIESRRPIEQFSKDTVIRGRPLQQLWRRDFGVSLLQPYFGQEDATVSEFLFGNGVRLSTKPVEDGLPVQVRVDRPTMVAALKDAVSPAARFYYQHDLLAIQDGNDGAALDLDGPNGQISIRARYVVAADGATSQTRKSAQIPFDRTAPTLFCLRALVDANGNDRDIAGYYVSAEANLSIHRTQGTATVCTVYLPANSPLVAERVDPVEILATKVKQLVGIEVDRTNIRDIVRFTNSSAVAATYRRNNIFLTGYAAHINFPAGGLGVNLGIEDVMNLGWKLARVIHGADPSILSTYQAERRPHAESVVALARLQSELLTPRRADDRYGVLLDSLVRSEDSARLLTSTMEGSIEWMDGGCALQFASNEAVRLHHGMDIKLSSLLRSGRFALVTPNNSVLPDSVLSQRGNLDIVESVCHSDQSLLVRPDGYIGWTGSLETDIEGLVRYLTTWSSLPA